MKPTPQDKIIAANLRPGSLCRDGFLGSDRRELWEILAADDVAVTTRGLTHERIADALGQALRAAMAACGAPIELPGGLRGVYREAMGRIPCPWGHGEVFPKGEMELTHEPSGEGLRVTPLSVHLIAAHGFYQGLGSRYRISPADTARLLGLVST